MKVALLGASLVLLSVASINASADTTVNKGTVSVPGTFGYNNTIVNAAPTPVTVDGNTYVGTSFYDDYQFTIAPGLVSSVTTSIDLGNILGISGLQALIYKGTTHETGDVVPDTLIQGWATTTTAGAFTVSQVVLAPVTLAAGAYTLQVRGVATGTTGGSYGGVFNIATVPEIDTYAMLIAGLSVMTWAVRRKVEKV